MKQSFSFFAEKVTIFKTIVALAAFTTVHSLSFFQVPNWQLYDSNTLADSLESPHNLDNLDILKLGLPPFRQDAPTNISIKPSPVNLTLLSATPNQITDDDAWFENNNLALPTYQVPNTFQNILGNIPARLPKTFRDNILVKAIHYTNEDFLIYGRNFAETKYLLIYDLEQNKITHGYDFSNYTFSPSYLERDRSYLNQTLNWVVPEDGILYFSHSHNTYAESSYGMNAYITALDRKNNQIIWRSQPQICNTNNFIIIDSVIICGYGFTAEADYLYLIDKNTGNILQQIKLKTAPEHIIPKDDKLHVRTYNMDYVFSIQR